MLVEKRREIFIYPKARNLTFRSLEILRRLGVGDQVDAVADHISTMTARTTLRSTTESVALGADFFLHDHRIQIPLQRGGDRRARARGC